MSPARRDSSSSVSNSRAGLQLARRVGGQRRLGGDAPRQAQRLRGDEAVAVGAEVVRRDLRCVVGARRGDAHAAAGLGVQVAHAGREGRVRMQRLAEGVERQRLHVVFEVRPLALRRRARERAELRRRHAHRPALRQRVLQRDARLARPGAGQRVERAAARQARDAEDGADLQVVLQVLADAGQIVQHLDAVFAQQRRRPDARELQQLRRADRAGGHHHRARGAQRVRAVARAQLDARGVQRAVAAPFDAPAASPSRRCALRGCAAAAPAAGRPCSRSSARRVSD